MGAAGKLCGPLIVSSGHLWAERRSAAGHLFSSQLVSLYNDLDDSVVDSVWLTGVKSRACFFIGTWSLLNICLQLVSLSLHSFYPIDLWDWGLRTDRASVTLLLPCYVIFQNNNNNCFPSPKPPQKQRFRNN